MRASAGHEMFAHSTLLVAHPLLTKPLVLPEAKAHSALKAHLLLFNKHICPAHLSKLVAPAPQLVEVKSVAPSAGFWLEDTARLPADIKVRSARLPFWLEATARLPAMDGQTDSQMQVVKCIECGTTEGKVGGNHSFRCGDCNSLKSRLQRLFQKSDIGGEFRALEKEKKQAFYRDNHEKVGADLTASVEEIVSRTVTHEESVLFQGTGEFIDEVDLRLKYTTKPGRAEKIMENSRTIYDHISATKLYEDMKYVSQVQQKDIVVDSHEQNLSQDRKLKRTGCEKKPKAKKEAEGAAAAEIPPAQKVKLQKMVEALGASKLVVQDKLKEIALLSEYVSPAVVTKASALAHELDAVIASITMTLEDNAGDLAEIKEKSEDLKSQAKQCVLLLFRGIKDGEILRDGLSGQPAAKKQRKPSTVEPAAKKKAQK